MNSQKAIKYEVEWQGLNLNTGVLETTAKTCHETTHEAIDAALEIARSAHMSEDGILEIRRKRYAVLSFVINDRARKISASIRFTSTASAKAFYEALLFATVYQGNAGYVWLDDEGFVVDYVISLA